MIECLTNYIGISGLCSAVTPGSGRYINDLPGMNLNKLESLSDSETEGFQGVWDKIYGRACSNMIADVIKYMPKDMKVEQVIDDIFIGRQEADKAAITTSNEYRGVYLRAAGSQYLSVFISRVKFYSSGAGAQNFHVFDSHTGEELWTDAITVVAGWNEIEINQRYFSRGDRIELFICYDGNDQGTIQTNDFGTDDCRAIAKGCKIAVGSSPIEDNLTFEGYTYGIILNAQIECAIDQFICENKRRLANALLYKSGIEFLMEQRMNDDVINRITLVPADEIAERVQMFEQMYINEIETALKNLEPVRDKVCFKCQSKIGYKSFLPG